MNEAKDEARELVKTDYPYAVYRDRQEISRLAERVFQKWSTIPSWLPKTRNGPIWLEKWYPNIAEVKRLFVSAFVPTYEEEVAKKDEAARPKVQPTPQPQPTAPPTPATPTGATITVLKAEHTGDIHSYWVKIADPLHFEDELDFPLPLVVDYSDTTDSDIGTVASSGTSSVRASAGSYSVTPSLSDKPKKPPRLYFGKGKN